MSFMLVNSRSYLFTAIGNSTCFDYLILTPMALILSFRKIQKMKVELNNLQNIDKMYDEKISLRKKQFHLFVVVLRDLQKMIERTLFRLN